MPRSRAHRRTSRTRSRARGSIWPHSLSKAALCRGVALFTERSMGTASEQSPDDGGTRSVTFGSAPRKAERRNLKRPLATRESVQARMAPFCRRRAASCCPAPAWRPAWCSRRCPRSLGLMWTTMSTSGTATPKAARPLMLPPATPTTSTNGNCFCTVFLTASAIAPTTRSDSAVGVIWSRSSLTWSSKLTPSNFRAATGCTLGDCTGVCGLWSRLVGARQAGESKAVAPGLRPFCGVCRP
mmetsp:Transcript_54156/g.142644  ORF Transcript_54156/g.142644 Transcript_54156/m.142644 type:complete len:241 (+) Transcript_54156:299-1021(+)